MRRSPELAPLSREHHVALAIALALRRAQPPDVDAAADRYLRFFAAEGAAHFDEEEAVLVPSLPAAMADRLTREHAEIRAATRALAERKDVTAAWRVGELLAAHVRFEERVVFTHLEHSLPAAELAAIGRRLRAPAAR
jgi:hypothetical protein